MKKNRVFVRFLKILGKSLPLFLFAMIIHMVGDNLFTIVLSIFVKNIFGLVAMGSMDGLGNIIFVSLIAGIIALTIFYIFGSIYDIEAKRGNAKVQKLVFDKALKLPMSYYENHHSGDIVSKLVYDADTASQIFTSRLRRVTTPIMSVVVYLIPMFWMCPQLTLCLFAINVIALVVNGKFIKPMKDNGKKMSQKNAAMTKHLSTMIQGIELVKIFAGSNKIVEDYKNDNSQYSKVQEEYCNMSSILTAINALFDSICSLAFLALAVVFIQKGITTVGEVAAIYTMYGSFSNNFLQIGQYFPELMNCIAHAEVIFDFLDEEEENWNVASIDWENESDKKIKYEYIDLDNVTFSYNSGKKVLDNFSMKVSKGKNVALTGQSGKGKSTIAKLILGFYPVESGVIRIEGKNISEIGIEKLREMIAYVPQMPYLFNVSIRDNIGYGKSEATEEEIIKAAKAANAHDFIMNQSHGYDTIVGERGSRLSGGECQRIAIARAIIKNAPILLLDEATSSLDNKAEQLVQSAIDNLLKDKTTLTIAHKPSTIAAADYEVRMG